MSKSADEDRDASDLATHQAESFLGAAACEPLAWPHLLVGFATCTAAFFVPSAGSYHYGQILLAWVFAFAGLALLLASLWQLVVGRGGLPRKFILVGTAVGTVLSVLVSVCTG